MGYFRKKPVVIQAFQLTGEHIDTMFEQFGGIGCTADGVKYFPYYAEIETLEGTMRADIGDYIITGVKGERYPCKPDIFQATYDVEAAHALNPQIENNFKYHAPKEGQPEKYATIREKAKELAYLIDGLCPQSRERSVALTELETAVMWANAAIARN